MHQAELMMAFLIASTALAGLTAVFMGQVAQASRDKKERVKRVDIITLLISFAMFLGVVICSINWFSSGNPWYAIGATCFFPLQIVAFTMVFINFWLNELKRSHPSRLPSEPEKLTMKNESPQKKRQSLSATAWAWILVFLLLASILAFSIMTFVKGAGGQYVILRDILTIVMAVAGVAIAAGGYLLYRLISEQVQGKAALTAKEEGQKSVARVLTLEGFFRWKDYKRAGQTLTNFDYVEWGIEVTKDAHEFIKGLDERKEDVETLLCNIRNNLAYYIAEGKKYGIAQKGDKELVMACTSYIRQRILKYPKYADEWAETCKFVDEQFR